MGAAAATEMATEMVTATAAMRATEPMAATAATMAQVMEMVPQPMLLMDMVQATVMVPSTAPATRMTLTMEAMATMVACLGSTASGTPLLMEAGHPRLTGGLLMPETNCAIVCSDGQFHQETVDKACPSLESITLCMRIIRVT